MNAHKPPPSPEVGQGRYDKLMQELDYFVEWGGPAWTRLTRGCLQELAEQRWFEGKRVIELGCRRGGMTGLFALLGAEVVGVDQLDTYMPAAEEMLQQLGVRDRCQLVLEDATTYLERNAGQFDFVFSKSVLVAVPAVDRMLDAATGALRPGGHFVALENACGNIAIQLMRRVRHRQRHLSTWRYFDRAQVESVRKYFRSFECRTNHFPPIYAMHGVK